MKRRYIVLVIILISAATAYGIYYGSSNLYGLYPSCNCYKPIKPFQFTSQLEIDNFRRDVDRYIDCVNDYINSAENDIQQILDEKENAYNEAQRFLNSL